MSQTPENLDVYEAATAAFRDVIYRRLQARADERDEARRERDALQIQLDAALARIAELESAQQPEPEPEPARTMLMGVSSSPHDQGGTQAWDCWRVYTRNEMLKRANQTGANRPKALAYSEDGPPLAGTYEQVKAHVVEELESFYYNPDGSRSSRWGIQLFWSNGNEMHDKGVLALPHTATGIARFADSQRGLYDGVMTLNRDGSRRYPDAYAGSNPTTEAERQGWVEDWTSVTAEHHHFQMWSMYPHGRKDTVSDPTFNYPSFDPASAVKNGKDWWLGRCFNRTAAHGIPMIAVGEVGIGNNPNDSTTRPWYVVHVLAHSFLRLADQYGLKIPFACWWDNELNGGPQNVLSDEQPDTSPSTREAWQNHLTYNHLRGGTHPATWAGNPKTTWKTTGTPPAK